MASCGEASHHLWENVFPVSQALVVGMGKFSSRGGLLAELGDLPYVARDVARVNRVLTAQGYDVEVVCETPRMAPTRRDVLAAMLRLAERSAADGSPRDQHRLIVYFAGYVDRRVRERAGKKEVNFGFCLGDCNTLSEFGRETSLYDVDDLLRDLVKYELYSERILLVVDACFARFGLDALEMVCKFHADTSIAGDLDRDRQLILQMGGLPVEQMLVSCSPPDQLRDVTATVGGLFTSLWLNGWGAAFAYHDAIEAAADQEPEPAEEWMTTSQLFRWIFSQYPTHTPLNQLPACGMLTLHQVPGDYIFFRPLHVCEVQPMVARSGTSSRSSAATSSRSEFSATGHVDGLAENSLEGEREEEGGEEDNYSGGVTHVDDIGPDHFLVVDMADLDVDAPTLSVNTLQPASRQPQREGSTRTLKASQSDVTARHSASSSFASVATYTNREMDTTTAAATAVSVPQYNSSDISSHNTSIMSETALSTVSGSDSHLDDAELVSNTSSLRGGRRRYTPSVSGMSNTTDTSASSRRSSVRPTTLSEAVLGGDVNMVREFLRTGSDVNAIAADGWTPLHGASFWGYVDIVMELLDAGANIHAVDERGYTPLHQAVVNEHMRLIPLLLLAGSDPFAAPSKNGRSAMQLARRTNNSELIRLLSFGRGPGSTLSSPTSLRKLRSSIVSTAKSVRKAFGSSPPPSPTTERGSTSTRQTASAIVFPSPNQF